MAHSDEVIDLTNNFAQAKADKEVEVANIRAPPNQMGIIFTEDDKIKNLEAQLSHWLAS